MKRVKDAMPIMNGAETRHKYKRVGCVLRYAVLFTLQTVFFTLNANAQNQPEYRLEIGGGIGALTYLGDFNGNLFKEIQPMGSILAKYRFDPRMALALNMSYGQLAGSAHLVGIMNRLIGETFAVMDAAGYRTFWQDAKAYQDVFYGKLVPDTFAHRSSTLQDIENRRRTEIDTLNGCILRLGERYGVPTPTHSMIVEMIRGIEDVRCQA